MLSDNNGAEYLHAMHQWGLQRIGVGGVRERETVDKCFDCPHLIEGLKSRLDDPFVFHRQQRARMVHINLVLMVHKSGLL